MAKRRGGFPGGMPGMNMNNIMKQYQKMQKKLEASQEEIANSEYNASTGGGAVNVIVSGDKRLKSIKIDPEAVDEDDMEMLEDMILAAVNQALTMADEASAQSMGEITGGLGLGL